MAVAVSFPRGFLALDPAQSYAPAKGASGMFYLRTDTARTAPLPITDFKTGNALPSAESDVNGFVGPVVVTVDVADPADLTVVWVSGGYTVGLESVQSVVTYLQPKLDQAASSAADAAASASESAATVTDLNVQVQNALAAIAADNDGGKVTDPPKTDPTILVHGPGTDWTATGYILALGQPGFATDTGELKIGDGTRTWDSLPAITGAGGGTISASDITDSTTTGRALIRASSAADAAGVLALGWLYTGTGNPNNAVSAPAGSVYARSDGGSNSTLYVKETGTGNTGWVAYGAAQTKASLGLGNVDNTSDLAKPVSTATAAALARRTVDYWADSSGVWPVLDSTDTHRRLHSTHIATADVPTDAMLNVGDQWYAHPDQAV